MKIAFSGSEFSALSENDEIKMQIFFPDFSKFSAKLRHFKSI